MLTGEELPLVLAKQVREDTLHELQAVSEAIRLEQRATDLRETEFDKAVLQVRQLLLGGRRVRFCLERSLEELDEAGERELVHVVDLDELTNDHEQVGTGECKVPVDVTLLIEIGSQLALVSEGLLDLTRLHLGLFETLNERLVLEDVALGAGKLLKQRLLIASKLNLEAILLLENLSFLRFKLRLLKVNRNRKQLTLETALSDSKVDVSDERLSVGWNLNKLITSRHVQLEGRIIVDRLVTDLHDLTRALLTQVFLEHREQHSLDAVDLLND